MKTLLIANLSTKIAGDGSNAWTPPDFSFGESLTLALRLVQSVVGQTLEPALNITRLSAAVGFVDARPASGTFRLQILGLSEEDEEESSPANTTAPLQHDCSAAALAGAINALGAVVALYGTAAVTKADGSWFIVFGAGAGEVRMVLRHNELAPLCLGRVNASAVDEVWTHELRLVQLPVAYTDSSERVLPPAPRITRVIPGHTDGTYKLNEVQVLFVPPDYRGSFALKFDTLTTSELTVEDNAESIQAALVAMLGDNVRVTVGAPFSANIEFINDLGGTVVDTLEVIVLDAPEGDLTFTLDLNRAELLAALRTAASVTLPLEVRLRVEEDDVETEIVAFRQDVTIQRPVQWPELAETPRIDWLRPPSPKSYVPFSIGGVVTGAQQYNAAFGDGLATAFSFNHGLATELISAVLVRENHDLGRVLGSTEYDVEIVSEDELTLTFAAPPAAGSLAVTISSSTPISALAAHTHSIADVIGLQAALDALDARVTIIEDLLPTAPPVRVAEKGTPFAIKLLDRREIFPGRFPATFSFEAAVKEGKGLPRAAALLPAIHTATVGDLPSPAGSASDHAGAVFANRIEIGPFTADDTTNVLTCTAHGRDNGDIIRVVSTGALPVPLAADTDYYVRDKTTDTFKLALTNGGAAIDLTNAGTGTHHAKRAGAAVQLSGGFGHRSFELPAWALAASDGRVWYPVSRRGTTTSYFPTDAERTLFTLPISPEMLRAGQRLEILFDLTLGLLKNTSDAQIVFAIEVGTAPEDSTPATTADNLQKVAWNATPLVEQRIVLANQSITHKFGCEIIRASDGSFSANGLLYNNWVAASQVPTDPTFLVRARLFEFDTENTVPTARGFVFYDFDNATANIS